MKSEEWKNKKRKRERNEKQNLFKLSNICEKKEN